MKSIYEVPLYLEKQGMTEQVLKILGLENCQPDLSKWADLIDKINNPKKELTVAIAGKYTELNDAYISVVESLKHAGFQNNAKINLKWIASEDIVSDEEAYAHLCDVDAIVVPGGFGVRGIEGKLKVVKYARENNVPYLGLCLGMQCAVIEFARNAAGLENANSTEFDKNTPYKVVDLMEEQKNIAGYGATMRLGSYPCKIASGTKAREVYGTDLILERHRHRFEFNTEYKEQLTNAGLVISGTSPDGLLTEIVEYPKNDWFVACQFHPEFKSRPQNPHPLFDGLIKTAIKQKES